MAFGAVVFEAVVGTSTGNSSEFSMPSSVLGCSSFGCLCRAGALAFGRPLFILAFIGSSMAIDSKLRASKRYERAVAITKITKIQKLFFK